MGPFSFPEPLVPISRLGLGHEEQVALKTRDLTGKNQTKGIQSDQPRLQTSSKGRVLVNTDDLIGFTLFYSIQ